MRRGPKEEAGAECILCGGLELDGVLTIKCLVVGQ